MKRQRRRGLALAAILLFTGCTYWEPQTIGPRDVLTAPGLGDVRLTTTEGELVVARVAEVRGDTIYGTRGTSGSLTCERAADSCNLRMPISEVGFVELRSFSAIKTAALVVVPVGTFLVIVAGGSCSSGPSSGPC